jgi:hypothetical protein
MDSQRYIPCGYRSATQETLITPGPHLESTNLSDGQLRSNRKLHKSRIYEEARASRKSKSST